MKILILFLGVFSISLVGGLFWFVYLNRADEKSISILFKIFVPILGAAILFLNDYLTTNLVQKKVVNVLFVANKSTGEPVNMDYMTKKKAGYITSGYSDILEVWSNKGSTIVRSNNKPKSFNEKMLDLVDAGFWLWYSRNFYSHWDVTRFNFDGINSKGANDAVFQESAKDVTKFKLNQLFVVGDHEFIKFYVGEKRIYLPKDCLIKKIIPTTNERVYELSLKEVDIEIKIIVLGGGKISGYDAISELLLTNASNPNELWENHFRVEFTAKYKRFYQWSPRTKRIRKWFLDLTEEFHKQVAWEIYRENVLRSI